MKTIKQLAGGEVGCKKTQAARLTYTERRAQDALAVISEGEISKRQLAKRLGVTERTVTYLVSSIRDKVDIVGRTAYCLKAERAVFEDTSAWGWRGLRADGISKIDEELRRNREKMKVAR